ncbi:MAG: C-GCAxxG-C-C family protein [Anaerolineales bacterium]|nr:C-GCAxxG-C-C family protein [Anaerolineales bacterium]
MIAVGEHLLGPLEDREIRMTTAFAGGIGGTYRGNCGAFSAGVMILGGLYGRSSSDEDDQDCQDLAEKYRERFVKRFEYLNCGELREQKFGSGREQPCSVLVKEASKILIGVIEEYQSTQHLGESRGQKDGKS